MQTKVYKTFATKAQRHEGLRNLRVSTLRLSVFVAIISSYREMPFAISKILSSMAPQANFFFSTLMLSRYTNSRWLP